MYLWLVTTLLGVALWPATAQKTCAVDEKKYFLEGVLEGGEVLYELKDKSSPDDCYERCCELAESEGCTAATFYSDSDGYVCKLLKCKPFETCKWLKEGFTTVALSARIAIVDTEVEKNFTWEQGDVSANENITAAQDSGQVTTLSWEQEEEKEEEELQEEIDTIFHGDDTWNVDASTTSWQPLPDDQDENWNEQLPFDSDADSDEYYSPPASGGDIIVEPGQMYPDDSLSPVAIFGVIVFVVTVLLLMVVLVRKVVQTQRLTYHPLGDKLNPAATDYDADDWDEVNTHLVRSG